MKLSRSLLRNTMTVFLLAVTFQISAQPLTLRIVDSDSSAPLPFVPVVIDGQLETSTNIDGYFTLESLPQASVSIDYYGYEPLQLGSGDLKDGKTLKLKKETPPQATNPKAPEEAERIMRLVVKNRVAHRPKSLNSYQYQSYDKLTLSLADETRKKFLNSLGNNPDSSNLRLKNVVDQQYLFLLESLSTKFFKKPNKEKKVVIASRVSGLEDPSFFILATQLQSFTFYRDYIKLFEKEFLSPVSPNSWNRYYFMLENSYLNSEKDTVFAIRFWPKKGKNFDGLQGILTINSDGYAIQSLRVSAAESATKGVELSITQAYDQLPSGPWFPKAMNSRLVVDDLVLPGVGFPSNSIGFEAFSKSYFTNIKINIPIDEKQFDGTQLTVKPSQKLKDTTSWEAIRYTPLSEKDSSIYHFTDSLGMKFNFDIKLKVLESLAGWRFPIGKVDILLDRIIGINKFEGLQLGLGMETNQDFSQMVKLGGYWRYGTKDDEDKYGGNVHIQIDSVSKTNVFVHYENDIKEDGAIEFLEQPEPFISQQLDVWYRRNFSYHQIYQAGIEGRIFPSTMGKAYWKNYKILNPTFINDPATTFPVDYNIIGAQIRMTFKERLFRQRGEIYSLGAKYPVLHINLERSLAMASDRKYQAIEFKLSDSYKIRNFGETEFVLLGSLRKSGGIMNLLASPPYSRPQFFSWYTKSSFSTMRINEFYTDKLLALFLRHNFGSLLFKYKELQPDIVLAFNAGIGKSDYDYLPPYPSISKGYFESGVLISKLVKLGFLKLGTGAFYRFGPYGLDSFKNNISLKFTMDFAL